MNLTELINYDITKAIIAKDYITRDILKVLKGEIERNKGKVELTDADIVKLVKKLIEGVVETTNNEFEIKVLEKYIPKQMSDNEMKIAINLVKDTEGWNSPKDMGKIMAHFKTNYDGLYDGKSLSNIVKEILN
jgi:uncharacterized protein YqeY